MDQRNSQQFSLLYLDPTLKQFELLNICYSRARSPDVVYWPEHRGDAVCHGNNGHFVKVSVSSRPRGPHYSWRQEVRQGRVAVTNDINNGVAAA